MPMFMVRQDITKMQVDAIVNPSNTMLAPGGGTDLAIHIAAGRGLRKACKKLNGCEVSQAKITDGFKLPCRFVIHTAGPVWKDGQNGEEQLLKECYRNCLTLAEENGCESVAFPLISSGSFGFPKDKVMKIAVNVISDYLLEKEMCVYIVVYDPKSFTVGSKLFSDIKSYIDDNYYEEKKPLFNRFNSMRSAKSMEPAAYMGDCSAQLFEEPDLDVCESGAYFDSYSLEKNISLEEALKMKDESFAEMLMRKIDEKGIKDSQCYKKANVDKKLFSKIRCNSNYKPKKSTVLAFAISLELDLEETREMLTKAGYALNHSEVFDIIVEYFIINKKYDIFEINQVLFSYDQNLLGSV